MRSGTPDGALPLFIGGGDRLGGEGVLNTPRMAYSSLLTPNFFRTPSPAKLVPSPYKQGESAIRNIFFTPSPLREIILSMN